MCTLSVNGHYTLPYNSRSSSLPINRASTSRVPRPPSPSSRIAQISRHKDENLLKHPSLPSAYSQTEVVCVRYEGDCSTLKLKRKHNTPLTIEIPASPRNKVNYHRIVNAHTPSPRSHVSNLQSLSAWIESARQRARQSKDDRSKLVAARLLSLHGSKPLQYRFPPTDVPRTYIRSCLSRVVSVEA